MSGVERNDGGTIVVDRAGIDDDAEYKRPRQFVVILHNDDFTPVEYVTALVMKVFRKTHDEASFITREVHERGAAAAGTYTHEIAETKAATVVQSARSAGYPLMASFEPVES